MLPSRSSRPLAPALALLAAAVPALAQTTPPPLVPVPDGPPAELGTTLLAGVRAAAAVSPGGGLLALHPLDVFDLQACLRGWTPCTAPLVATAAGDAAAPRTLVSPPGSRLVFGAVALAAAADGGAVAAWEAGPSCDRRTGTCRGADGDGTAVYVRPLAPRGPAGGQPGPVLRIHAATAGDQARPAAAAGPGGAFVVLWQSRRQDGSGWGVYGRRYGPGFGPGSGIELGEEIRIAPGTLGDHQVPAVALGTDGSFLAAWQGALGGTAGQGIFVRAFDRSGRPRGRGVRIDSGGSAPASDPALAAVPGGSFVIVWRSRAGATWHLFARRLGRSGRPLGAPLRLTSEPVAAGAPSVAADETGGFLVAWSAVPAGAPGAVRQVAASYVDVADQLLAGGELIPRPGQNQHDPVVASDGRRSYGVVWGVSTVIRRAPATSYSALRLTLPEIP